MYLSETHGIVYLVKPADHQSAGIDGDSFNIGRANWATVVLQFGAVTGNAVLTVNTGASAGTKTTAETFTYRLASGDQAAASADLFGATSTSAALTLTAATYDNKTLIVEIDPATLTDAQPWVTINLSDAASELFVSGVAILQPRYGVTATTIA